MVDVTVLTPSYNYGRFIEDALMSVHGLRGVSVQHVIQDAGSSDDTLEVLARSRDVEWSSEPDRGQSDALNKALARATGHWIAWLNADEFYLPGGLASLIRRGERSGADLIYGDSVFVDEAGCVERLLARYRFSPAVLRTYGTFISSCSVIFRRSVLGDAAWDVDIHRVMDWDLYMRLLRRGARFLYVPYPVGAFRLHPAQVTASPWQEWQEEDELVATRYGGSKELTERWNSYKRGRWFHRAHKLMGGAYVREMRGRASRGKDLRWFSSEPAYANFIELLERCYGRASSGTRRHR